jgi:hypothetical protein
MPQECAFCPETANRSGEHLWSDWMAELLPGKKQLTIRGTNREIKQRWTSKTLDWTAKVVCQKCNNGWMSDIESYHAKPSMSDLIIGKDDIQIDQAKADSIALFAFKSAVVVDYLRRAEEPFFDRSTRHNFKNSLSIPKDVGMWLTKFAQPGRGEISTTYLKGNPPDGNGIEMYVCTYAVEYLVIQVVGFRHPGLRGISTKDKFTAVPFWPRIADAFVWPPAEILQSVDEFKAFSDRWNDVITI